MTKKKKERRKEIQKIYACGREGRKTGKSTLEKEWKVQEYDATYSYTTW